MHTFYMPKRIRPDIFFIVKKKHKLGVDHSPKKVTLWGTFKPTNKRKNSITHHQHLNIWERCNTNKVINVRYISKTDWSLTLRRRIWHSISYIGRSKSIPFITKICTCRRNRTPIPKYLGKTYNLERCQYTL